MQAAQPGEEATAAGPAAEPGAGQQPPGFAAVLASYVATGNCLFATYDAGSSPGEAGPPAAELDADPNVSPEAARALAAQQCLLLSPPGTQRAGKNAAEAAAQTLNPEPRSAARSALGSCGSPADAGVPCADGGRNHSDGVVSLCACHMGSHFL